MKELKVSKNSKIIVNDDESLTLIGTKAHNLYFKTMNGLRYDNEELTQEELAKLTDKKVIEILNSDFINDMDKMDDFLALTKKEFLSEYSYLTEQEYDNTEKSMTS